MNGVMRLTFGNMTFDVNIFSLFKLDEKDSIEIYEISFIDSLVHNFINLAIDTSIIDACIPIPNKHESLLCDNLVDVDHVKNCISIDDVSIGNEPDVNNDDMLSVNKMNLENIIK